MIERAVLRKHIGLKQVFRLRKKMVVIRLARRGSKHNPKYRVAVADSRRSATGRFIEIIGHYDPLSKDKKPVINQEKYESWIGKGAKPSQTVESLYKKTQNINKSTKQENTNQKGEGK